MEFCSVDTLPEKGNAICEGITVVTPWDSFIDSIEQRKKQLDEVLEAYKAFRQKLAALPRELALEAERSLSANQVQQQERPPRDTPSTAEEPTSEEQETVLLLPSDKVIPADLAGKTSLECAMVILTEKKNEPTHFSSIAKEAMRRGYQGRTSGTSDEVEQRTIKSFWASMSRSDDLDGVGRGFYRLKKWHQ